MILLGKEIVPPTYDQVWDFRQGKAKVRKEGKYSLINIDGETLLSSTYDKIDTIGVNLFLTHQARKNGLIILDQNWRQKDRKGRPMLRTHFLPPEYDEIRYPFHGPFIPVKQDNKWGFVKWEKQESGENLGVLNIPLPLRRSYPF